MRLHFKLISGEEQEFFTEKDSFTIGRSRQADIVLPYDGMSRKHCFIENVNGKLFVTDLGSMNGVFLDDKRILPDTRTALPMYLNLSFGAVQSLQIDLQDGTKVGIKIPVQGQESASSGPEVMTTVTSTSTVATPKKAARAKIEKPATAKTAEKNINIKQIFFLALTLTFLATVAYVMVQEKMHEDEPLTPEEMYE